MKKQITLQIKTIIILVLLQTIGSLTLADSSRRVNFEFGENYQVSKTWPSLNSGDNALKIYNALKTEEIQIQPFNIKEVSGSFGKMNCSIIPTTVTKTPICLFSVDEVMVTITTYHGQTDVMIVGEMAKLIYSTLKVQTTSDDGRRSVANLSCSPERCYIDDVVVAEEE